MTHPTHRTPDPTTGPTTAITTAPATGPTTVRATGPVRSTDTAVVGDGIVGLAHALAAARRGDRVVLFERDSYAVGASIRNFGMIWAIGQQRGAVYQRALRSREIWLELGAKTGMWAEDCTARAALDARMRAELPFHREHGIHVLLSQTADGRLTIGDSHAYAATHDPFASEEIDQAILGSLREFARIPDPRITERWTGCYPSLRDGRTELVADPEPGVTVVNGVGAAGMTLSFGLAEEVLGR